MEPSTFPQANVTFKTPADLDESQVRSIKGYSTKIVGGPLDGSSINVVAWLPSSTELETLNQGLPLFITMLGGLAPHYPSVSFEAASQPQ